MVLWYGSYSPLSQQPSLSLLPADTPLGSSILYKLEMGDPFLGRTPVEKGMTMGRPVPYPVHDDDGVFWWLVFHRIMGLAR